MEDALYTFPPTGTKIADVGEGRVIIKFSDVDASEKEAVDEAEWVRDIVVKIHKNHEENDLSFLVFGREGKYVHLDAESRTTYKYIIEQPFIDNIALVGTDMNFAQTITIRALLAAQNQKRFCFFSDEGKARKWLEWE